MKSRRILFAVAAVIILLGGWLAWRAAHRTPRGPVAGGQVAVLPSATPSAGPGVQAAPEAAGGTVAGGGATATATPGAGPVPGRSPVPVLAAGGGAGAGAPQEVAPDWRATAMVELQKVHTMIGSYHTLMGQNPVGTNAEIMKALMGGNPRGALLGPPPGQSLNAKGELVDPWGTPYFFHQLSGDDMEIHSAGPDKIMGTADDLVIP